MSPSPPTFLRWSDALAFVPALLFSLILGGFGLCCLGGALFHQDNLPGLPSAPLQAMASPETPATAAQAPQVPSTDWTAKGQQVYSTICIACHQPTGRGMPNLFPSLAGSDWVAAEQPDRIIAIVLRGLQGPLTLNGVSFTTAMMMPPQGAVLNDAQIAAALTFVRSSWGNHAPAVTEEQVRSRRAKLSAKAAMWTAEELIKTVPLTEQVAQTHANP